MINIYSNSPTSSFVMYPDTPVVATGFQTYRLSLTQSLDNSTSSIFTVNRVDTRQNQSTSEVIVLQALSGSEMPSADGQYTASLYLGKATSKRWGEVDELWSDYHLRFSETDPDTYSGSIVASDRAYVHGTNLQTITTYTGTDQTGTYTTYNN